MISVISWHYFQSSTISVWSISLCTHSTNETASFHFSIHKFNSSTKPANKRKIIFFFGTYKWKSKLNLVRDMRDIIISSTTKRNKCVFCCAREMNFLIPSTHTRIHPSTLLTYYLWWWWPKIHFSLSSVSLARLGHEVRVIQFTINRYI